MLPKKLNLLSCDAQRADKNSGSKLRMLQKLDIEYNINRLNIFFLVLLIHFKKTLYVAATL